MSLRNLYLQFCTQQPEGIKHILKVFWKEHKAIRGHGSSKDSLSSEEKLPEMNSLIKGHVSMLEIENHMWTTVKEVQSLDTIGPYSMADSNVGSCVYKSLFP